MNKALPKPYEIAEDPEIRRLTLHEEIVDRLREMIFQGDLMVGNRVPERDLCLKFSISRTPLREALKVLANEGLITLQPNRGAWVTQLTAGDVDELFPIMGSLEALSGELACQNATDADIAEVKALHYEMAMYYTRGDRPNYFKVNRSIHEKIMEIAANPSLLQFYRSLSERIRRARYLANISANRWDASMKEHELILGALEGRNGVLLADLLKAHLLNKKESVKKVIADPTCS